MKVTRSFRPVVERTRCHLYRGIWVELEGRLLAGDKSERAIM